MTKPKKEENPLLIEYIEKLYKEYGYSLLYIEQLLSLQTVALQILKQNNLMDQYNTNVEDQKTFSESKPSIPFDPQSIGKNELDKYII